MSVAGKHVLVTGATAGIGEASALALAEQGAEVSILARNPDKGAAVLEQLQSRAPGQEHQLIIADFANLASVREAAAVLLEAGRPVDVLLNNAGIVNTKRRLSADGYEETFAVNHLAPFLLTGLLLPLVPKQSGRIVTVSSGAHAFVKAMNFDDIHYENGYSTFTVYGQSKLANILFTLELAKRTAADSICCNSLHPGGVRTGLGTQNETWMSKWLPQLLAPFFKTPLQGAATSIYLASDEQGGQVTGEYFVNCKLKRPKPWALDAEAASKLWRVSEDMTDFNYPE